MNQETTGMLAFSDCEAIERLEGAPFYFLDSEGFVANFKNFLAAFERHYQPIRIGYSYKTNYIPHLCKLVNQLGGYAEVVSRLEYDLALRIGQDPKQIIFNGPMKRREDVELALSNGSTLQIDSFGELEMVLSFVKANPAARPRVGLRINSCLTDASGASHLQEGLAQSRFGFPVSALREVSARLRAANLPVRTLHGHTSSSTRQCWIFERIAGTLCDLASTYFPDTLEEINVGGGFFGPLPAGFGPPDAPSYEDYARAIAGPLKASAWAQDRKPVLVLEPGVALAANVLSFVTKIYEIKEIAGRSLAIADGNVFHTKPSGHNKQQPHHFICRGTDSAPERVLSVTGSTCMEKDYLLTDVTCALQPGDYVSINNVGAYTIVMSPTFIHPAPAIVARGANGFVVVRRKQTFDEAFASYTF
jgi:diaminopimelate decarboxylase